MGVSLARQQVNPPQVSAVEMKWIGLCTLRAKSLRDSADSASPLQTERAVIEYGAAAALERAAQHWGNGELVIAQAWMAAAENTMNAALIPVPWRR